MFLLCHTPNAVTCWNVKTSVLEENAVQQGFKVNCDLQCCVNKHLATAFEESHSN